MSPEFSLTDVGDKWIAKNNTSNICCKIIISMLKKHLLIFRISVSILSITNFAGAPFDIHKEFGRDKTSETYCCHGSRK